MKRIGCGRAGALAGLFTAPVGGVTWALANELTGAGGQDFDDSTINELAVLFVFYGVLATIVAGVPGALLRFAIGKGFGYDRLEVRHIAFAAIVGGLVGIGIAAAPNGGRETALVLTAALAGMVAGVFGFTVFSLLRPTTPDVDEHS